MRKYGLKKIKHHDSVLRTSFSRVACLFKGAMSRLYSSFFQYCQLRGFPMGFSGSGISLTWSSEFGILKQTRGKIRDWRYAKFWNFGSGLRDWRTLLGTLNYVPLHAMELKKLLWRLVNNKITASCQNRKRSLEKCYAMISFQKPQFESFLSFQRLSIRVFFWIFCAINILFFCFEKLFSFLLQIGGSSQCLNFDKLHNAAPLAHIGLF